MATGDRRQGRTGAVGGDLRARLHQEAFPDEDISDRPLPETLVPAFLKLVANRPGSGRVRLAEIVAWLSWTSRCRRAWRRPSRRRVDGLLTGFHEPRASHLDMLAAIADGQVLDQCYAEAVEHGYLWHEFGDLNLLLP